MASVAEYLSQLQTLTQRNLEILKAINDSFFTKKEHHVQCSFGVDVMVFLSQITF